MELYARNQQLNTIDNDYLVLVALKCITQHGREVGFRYERICFLRKQLDLTIFSTVSTIGREVHVRYQTPEEVFIRFWTVQLHKL